MQICDFNYFLPDLEPKISYEISKIISSMLQRKIEHRISLKTVRNLLKLFIN